MEREPEFSIRICSDPHLLATVRATIDALAKNVGFNDKSRALLTLAVDEALANVIRHGYEERTDGMIWINLWRVRNPPGLRIVVDDLGKSVDPAKIKGRDIADIRPGGLGVHIIKETMNEARWEARPEGGMRLTLVKWLSSQELEALSSTQSENTSP